MADFMTRLLEEKEQLDEKRSKLGGFIASEGFNNITPTQQHLLNIQSFAMATYSQCLLERIVSLRQASASDDGSNPPNGPGTPP
jgi:hypothetical protein